MKRIKNVNALLQTLAIVLIISIAAYTLFGINPYLFAGLVIVCGLLLPMPKGVLSATVYREVWTGQIIKYLTTTDTAPWLDGLQDYSAYVSNVGDEMQVIHLAAFPNIPNVLLNNTTYPIAIQDLASSDIPISLDKYQTEITPLSDDELFALSFSKMTMTVQRHGTAIAISKYGKAIHSLAPSGNTAAMPVLKTTGDDDGTGRRKLLWADVVSLKRQLDDLQYPPTGRRFVLCTDHENDLINNDQRYMDQYYNRATGKPFAQLGFDLYGYANNPYYNVGTLTKNSYGAIPGGTDRRASVFFSTDRAVTATGWTKMYYKIAAINPGYQRNEVNFRHYFIALPTAEEARGAIISDNV